MTRRLLRLAAAVLVAAGLLAASPAAPSPVQAGGATSAPDATEVFGADGPGTGTVVPAEPGVEHVVVISIDGLRADVIAKLGDRRTPNLHRLLREGAGTLNARNMVERTVTLPNHTSMMTGQRITASQGGHGVTFNGDNGRTIHASAGRYVAGVFDVVHDHGLSTGLYVGKIKFDILDRSWNATEGAPDTTGADDGRDKLDTYVRSNVERALQAMLAQLTSDDADAFAFLHLSQPDHAGHEDGWMSKQYLAAVEEADEMVGEVLAAIDASERSEDTIVILTTDHGGTGTDHSDVDKIQNYRIPFMVWGMDVPAGADLYELNPATRLDPGTSRPGYTGVQPIRNGEVANLALDLLGLPPVPGSIFDHSQDLEVRD
jgi:hypothetical protein